MTGPTSSKHRRTASSASGAVIFRPSAVHPSSSLRKRVSIQSLPQGPKANAHPRRPLVRRSAPKNRNAAPVGSDLFAGVLSDLGPGNIPWQVFRLFYELARRFTSLILENDVSRQGFRMMIHLDEI